MATDHKSKVQILYGAPRETDKALANELILKWETQVVNTNNESTTGRWDASGFSIIWEIGGIGIRGGLKNL